MGLVEMGNGGMERLWGVLITVNLFLSFVICNVDRINLSIAIIPLSERLGLSSGEQGKIHGSFFVGYMLTQIPGGYLSDRFSGLPILSGGVFLWSMFTILTPVAAGVNVWVLLGVRMLLGLGEGVAMPAMNAIVSKYIQEDRRARSLAFVYSGMFVGSIVGLASAPGLIERFGWEAVFYVYGAVGMMWSIGFVMWWKSIGLEDMGNADSAELENAEDGRLLRVEGERNNVEKNDENEFDSRIQPNVWELIRNRYVFAIIVAHFCSTWGYFVLLSWLPTFLYLRYEASLEESALLSILPWLSMFMMGNMFGMIADGMIAKGYDITKTRKLMQGIAFIGPIIALWLVRFANNEQVAVGIVSSGLGFSSAGSSGVYATHQDIGPKLAGTLLGISNTVASVPGIIGVYISGVILDKTDNNWDAVFDLAIIFYGLGFIAYQSLATSRRQW